MKIDEKTSNLVLQAQLAADATTPLTPANTSVVWPGEAPNTSHDPNVRRSQRNRKKPDLFATMS